MNWLQFWHPKAVNSITIMAQKGPYHLPFCNDVKFGKYVILYKKKLDCNNLLVVICNEKHSFM